MNSANSKQQVFFEAKRAVRLSNSFTSTLAKIFISRYKLPYFYCWYAYFRWVDDTADTYDISLQDKVLFISAQQKLVESFYSTESKKPLANIAESYLRELIIYDQGNGSCIKKFIFDMLSCIQFDIKRINTYTSKEYLENYFTKEVLSYLNTFQFFCTPPRKYLEIRQSKEGIAGKWIHILRDFRKDIEEKIFNLPKEDVVSYQIDITDVNSQITKENFKRWVMEKISGVSMAFREGKKRLIYHPSWKYKMIVLILCFKYQLYQKEISKAEFILKKDYVLSRLLIWRKLPLLCKEIVTFSFYHLAVYKLRLLKVK